MGEKMPDYERVHVSREFSSGTTPEDDLIHLIDRQGSFYSMTLMQAEDLYAKLGRALGKDRK